MSSLAFLTSELQSLSSETKRKHPDIRDAAEKALVIIRSLPTSEQSSTKLKVGDAEAEELLKPIFMGCASKNAKVTAICLSCLQRLLSLHAVPLASIPPMLHAMNECMSQGVDIQLRILQTLLSLITNFWTLHGRLLGDALIICFKMQESRIAVVSSTAAATLRQIVMFIIDKVVEEDRNDRVETIPLTEISLPDNSKVELGPSAVDAYSVVEDLCLLANTEKPHFLRLGSLPKTFALELIESVLTNYHDLFRKHTELLILLRHHLCPLLLKLLSDKPIFPLILRSARVVFLLLKQFADELPMEVEVFLALLIKIVGGDSESESSSLASRPPWMRVIAMEIIRGLCNDAHLMRQVWERFDSVEGGTRLFGSLISVLNRLMTEKPVLLGVSSQMFGVGVSSHHSDDRVPSTATGYSFDVGSVAGMVANAASATMTNVVGMMNVDHGLSLAGSAMKLQCIDQLDKADSPPIPEAYIYLLGLQCLISICEGFASSALPLFNAIVVQRSRAAGEATLKAPSALDIPTLAADDSVSSSTKHVLRSVHGMIENGWPGLLAALSFVVATNLSDSLFADALQSYLNVANVSGMLGLTIPRDAFLTSLAKFAIPSRVVSSIEAYSYVEPATPRIASASGPSSSEGSGAPGAQAPGLSERNMACLKILVTSAMFLAGSLGPSWFDILETLQNADYVLTSKGQRPAGSSKQVASNVPHSPGPSNRSASVAAASNVAQPQIPLFVDLDAESVQRSIQRLFDSSKNLDDNAFHDFVSALCRLSSEMVKMQSSPETVIASPVGSEHDYDRRSLSAPGSSHQDAAAHRRRISGIHLPRTLRGGDFGINKLGSVSRLNVVRFTHRSPDVAWNVVTTHLVEVLRNNAVPHSIRIQATHILDNDLLLLIPRNWGSSEERRSAIQLLLLGVLEKQVAPDLEGSGNSVSSNATLTDIRKLGQETLHQILQSAGHTIIVGWDTVFSMLSSACEPSAPRVEQAVHIATPSPPLHGKRASKPAPLGFAAVPDKGSTALVRVAFQSLTLVCDSLSTLSPDHLRLCISTLGRFGRQMDTNIALTAAGSLLWGVSDSLQAKRKEGGHMEAQYNSLWMFLLLEVLGLCTDPRPEVRVGAIQTLFRTLQLYGSTLSLDTWEDVLWKVTFPLLDTISQVTDNIPPASLPQVEPAPLGAIQEHGQAWDESKTLALQSIGGIFNDFLISKIIHLESFERGWDTFVSHIQKSFVGDSAGPCTAALRCLERAVRAAEHAPEDCSEKVGILLEKSWLACGDMGGVFGEKRRSTPFEQECLLAYVDVIRAIRSLTRWRNKQEWTLDRLSRLLTIVKAVITYSDSPSYRPDVDSLSPVQSAVISLIADIDLAVAGSPSLILRDLSSFVTLPFVAAFEVQRDIEGAGENAQQRIQRVTYIAVAKKVMPLLLDIFLRFGKSVEIFEDETVESILASYCVPIKLKYECPPSSRLGHDPPLWKTATTCFLRIVHECSMQLRKTDNGIRDMRVEGIWRQIIEGFSGAILADCHHEESLPQEERDAAELFDFALIAAIESDVVPYVADSRVPDHLSVQLASVLQKGSVLYHDRDITDDEPETDASPSESSMSGHTGSTAVERTVPRERFASWCLDLLFSICSKSKKDDEALRRRVAALSLRTLLNRCNKTLVDYLADQSIRGSYPLSRIREEELVHVLRKLLTLRLWSGTLWAAFSDTPSQYASEQPGFTSSSSPAQLLAEAGKRSWIAHLFHFYDPLCQIVAIPQKLPSAWVAMDVLKPGRLTSLEYSESAAVPDHKDTQHEELDARRLATACLEEIGKEFK